jgi:hypothetical protein
LECATNFVTAPEVDDSNVPTDTLLWGYAAEKTRLLGPSGNVVATDERKLPTALEGGGGLGTLPVLIPREPLEPNADYTIEIDGSGDQAPPRRIVFSTGAGPTDAAPPLPLLLSSEPRTGVDYYGAFRAVSLTFDFDGILIGDTGQLGEVASIDALFAQADAALADPNDEALPKIQWISRSESLFVGIAACGVWPLGAADSELGRFGVLDRAGNFSGWVSVPLDLPSRADAEAEREAQRNLNVQQGRPSACSLGLPGGNGAGERSRGGLFALAVGLAVTGARRARRAAGTASRRARFTTRA